jgi:hypothetical protein
MNMMAAKRVYMRRAVNPTVWAIGKQLPSKGFFVRVVTLGHTYAREQVREGEEIREAAIMVAPRRK